MYRKLNPARIRYLLVIGLLVLVASAACTTAPSTADVVPAAVSVEPDTLVLAETTVIDSIQVESPEQNDSAYPAVRQVALNSSSIQVATGELSDAEKEDLIFMREEEKLARDVYLTLYDQWGLPLFQNIAGSEQTHTDSIKTLLDRYGLEDPVMSNDIGQFTNLDLQALYDQLIVDGSQSISGALRVGVAIEEIDILDLLEALAHTDKADIVRVYENLMFGSENHLRAFVSTLERQTGEIYVPLYLSQQAYDAIINASSATGGGYGGGGGNGKGGSQGNGGGGNGRGQTG